MEPKEKFDFTRKIKELEYWLELNQVPAERVSRVFDLLNRRGARNDFHPTQNPSCYICDKEAHPWHNANNYNWVKMLEENFKTIQKEALAVFER